MSKSESIGAKKLEEIVNNYENLVISEHDILFFQFKSEKLDENQLLKLQDWLFDKLVNQTFPRYNEQFNIKLALKRFPTHLEIENLSKLPEEKITKIFSMFEWVLKKF